MKNMFESLWRFLKSINKKIWVTAAFIAVIFAAGTTWIVVANALTAFKPVSWDGLSEQERQTVSGNGGPAVMVGNWLYFVGNYVDSSTIKYRQNEYNKVTYGAIYRAYIDPDSGLLYENADESHTDPSYIPHLLEESKYEIVVPKIAGFDQAALWVFGKHLVYNSPNNTKDKVGQLQLGKIDFFRVDLDGRNHRKIYTTANEMVTTSDFTVASYVGKIFLLIKDGEMLRRVDVTGKPGHVVTISEKVESFALPVVTSYRKDFDDEENALWRDIDINESYSGIMCYAYYTEALTEEEQESGLHGNKLFQYHISGNTKFDVRIAENTIKVMALSNGRLIYSVSSATETQLGIGGEILGLFATSRPISKGATCPFDIAPVSKGAEYLEDYRLLENFNYQENEIVYLPTVLTPNVVSRFVTLADTNMYIYEEGKDEFKIVEGVSKIITITGSTVHYLNSAGSFMAVDLNNGAAVNMGSVVPEVNIRPWVVTRNNRVWYFHIKTLEEQHAEDHEEGDTHASTTVAVLLDLSNGGAREFVLGRPDCSYFGHEDCTQ